MANLAVINMAGVQHVVRVGDEFEVNRLSNELNEDFTPVVLLSTKGENVLFNEGSVSVQAVEHKKGEKLQVHKFRAKSRYTKRHGHRQHLTVIKVISINGEEKASNSVEKEPKVEKKAAVKKSSTKRVGKKTENSKS